MRAEIQAGEEAKKGGSKESKRGTETDAERESEKQDKAFFKKESLNQYFFVEIMGKI